MEFKVGDIVKWNNGAFYNSRVVRHEPFKIYQEITNKYPKHCFTAQYLNGEYMTWYSRGGLIEIYSHEIILVSPTELAKHRIKNAI